MKLTIGFNNWETKNFVWRKYRNLFSTQHDRDGDEKDQKKCVKKIPRKKYSKV